MPVVVGTKSLQFEILPSTCMRFSVGRSISFEYGHGDVRTMRVLKLIRVSGSKGDLVAFDTEPNDGIPECATIWIPWSNVVHSVPLRLFRLLSARLS
jgi:hypothetical protein